MKILAALVMATALSTPLYAAGFNFNLEGLVKAIADKAQPPSNSETSSPSSPANAEPDIDSTAVPANTKPKNYLGFLPIGWNDKKYNPDMLDGSLHLRIGSNGQYLKNPHGGTPSCDLAYLYYSRNDKAQLQGGELEYCALREFHIYKTITGDERNLGDGFVKQDTINEFSRASLKRLGELKKHDAFYIRAVAVQVDPYNFQTKSFPIRINMMGESTDEPKQRNYYNFVGNGFKPQNSNWLTVNLAADGDVAREMEAARVKPGGFIHGMNEVHFRVKKAIDATRSPSNPGRNIEIEVTRFKTNYVNSQGQAVDVGFGF